MVNVRDFFIGSYYSLPMGVTAAGAIMMRQLEMLLYIHTMQGVVGNQYLYWLS